MKVIAIGDMNVDLIVSIKEMPHRGEQVLADGIQIHGGGCAANFALACTRLGAKSKLFAKVGDDLFGNHVLQTLKTEGVDVRDVVLGANTGATVALIQGLDRSFISYPGENANFSMRDVNPDRIKGDLVHLPSFFLLKSLGCDYLELIEKIDSKMRIKITFDTGFDPGGFKMDEMEYLKSVIKRADVFFPNLTEAARIMGIKGQLSRTEQFALVKKYLAYGLETIVITKGEEGCLASDGGETLEIPAFDINVEDTTGAGDVFNAGFVVSYLDGKSLEECCRFASAAAAISITGKGWTSYPTKKDIREFLEDRG